MDVEAALKGIDDSKSLGIDGFNSFFFKQTWPVVKFDILQLLRSSSPLIFFVPLLTSLLLLLC